jgi:hypothetical protein
MIEQLKRGSGLRTIGWWTPQRDQVDPTIPYLPLEDPAGGGEPTIVETDANSAGSSTGTGVAAAIWNAVGTSSGAGTVAGISAAVWASVGSSAGVANTTGLASAVWSSAGSSAGVGTASGVGASFSGTVGSSDGAGLVAGVSAAVVEGVGSSDGLSTVAGSAATVGAGVASSAGVAEGLGAGEAVSGFPTQYDGTRLAGSTIVLSLVAEVDAPAGMGGVVKIMKNGTVYALYLVETTDPDASPLRIQTTTGIKSIRLMT